jgi:hypothetical protein
LYLACDSSVADDVSLKVNNHIATLTRERDEARSLCDETINLLHDADRESDTLKKQRDEARRDAERLDWLGKQMDGVHVEAGVAGGEYQMSWFATVYTFCDEFRAGTVREAIDKAMNHALNAASGCLGAPFCSKGCCGPQATEATP